MTVEPLLAPGRGGGLPDVARRRYLLRLLVRRELRSRYQGSLLGLGWSYVRPAVNFAVYFFVVGVFLKMSQAIPNFPVFLFSGMVLISFFTETLITTAWSVVGNASLVKKVYLPRELFPVSSMLVSGVHMLPALAVLMGGAVWAGWAPSWIAVGSMLLAFGIVATLAMAFGLLFAAVNVFFRDFGQVVDIINIVVPWSVPMIYPWTTVQEATQGGWLLQAYLANPLTSAVLLFERAFWWPTNDQALTLPNGAPALPGGRLAFPYHLTTRGLASLLGALVLLAVAQLVFARLQRRFAQEL
ncbi:ABC transporter permease [Actinomadura sp. DC4]|uniref:ABC transporter permease n=1 Tax=Actinomadura sp. DC4 TaxID=3055069 RepID=UPI0025AFBBCE|nr:ABC transporter permease [Actinomadura sp. DC4]MDN3357991.1 ABC transporter permease [Actinomadura sp. DC4]